MGFWVNSWRPVHGYSHNERIGLLNKRGKGCRARSPWSALSSARSVWSRSMAALPVFSVRCCCSGYCDGNRPQPRGCFDYLKEVALACAFAIKVAGVDGPGTGSELFKVADRDGERGVPASHRCPQALVCSNSAAQRAARTGHPLTYGLPESGTEPFQSQLIIIALIAR